MKPVQAILSDNASANKIFLTKEIVQPFFSTEFHFHRECQLVYVVESSGQRIVGDSVEHFEHGELVFLGSNVPHVWHNEKKYFEGSGQFHAHSMAMYISPDQLLEALAGFGTKPAVESWLVKVRRGIIFQGKTKEKLVELLKETFRQDGIGKIVAFLNMLDTMMHASEYRLLSSPNYVNSYSENDQHRMDKLFKFIFTNFKRDIPLREIASLANMNEFSFCRYFKSRTQKPFTLFVNELRIGHACKLIQEKNWTIDHLAYECGFNNVTHFNRLFKRVKGITPKAYRKQLVSFS
ncbi:AraC family transcriptional regulator [Larkinella knui]|uniref:AraC family transcriptional regulator n=1 Tax=Larkinella knui TaxID=2025310 RepID=A0A3P1CH86_9BACT|nr:AraC family transcriptional regulator [Larkinella knui]RRB12396.1 AraC family transcriptional regulator [Larkinella knui]